jgi:Na+-transporting NADH:ubiquinone oxidoreductase subunit NqrF
VDQHPGRSRRTAGRPEHYDVVGDALIEALRAFAGESGSPEYEQGWRDAYAVIAAKMMAGAAADTNPPYWHAEVVSHERRGTDIAVFTCRPMQPLPYQAGQYVSVECRYQPRLWRVYSMANAPREDGLMEFHVRAVGNGWVSSALVRRVKAGDMIRLAAPMGSLTLGRKSTRDIVCIAGGTGLAPIKALVEELTRYNRTRWVHRVRLARHGQGHPAPAGRDAGAVGTRQVRRLRRILRLLRPKAA